MNLSKDFSEFIQLLNEHGVEYLIVGGYAVILHGYPRYTGDMDFFINKSSENAQKVIDVLDEFGFASLELTADELTKPDVILQLGRPPLRIDIINSLSGVSFKECFAEKVKFEIDGYMLPVIGLKQLKKNKKASGRHRDLDDLEHL
jgi:predicted nucleotidyltransferase